MSLRAERGKLAVERNLRCACSLLRAGMMLKSGGARLARALRRNGIKVVFGIPGTHTVPLYKGLQELQPEITTITTRHESGAG